MTERPHDAFALLPLTGDGSFDYDLEADLTGQSVQRSWFQFEMEMKYMLFPFLDCPWVSSL